MAERYLSLFCTCGAHWQGYVHEGGARIIQGAWHDMHAGEGHAPCDAATARRARRKAEKKEERADA